MSLFLDTFCILFDICIWFDLRKKEKKTKNNTNNFSAESSEYDLGGKGGKKGKVNEYQILFCLEGKHPKKVQKANK